MQWQQYDLTGKRVSEPSVSVSDPQSAKTTCLAMAVQLSVAKLDDFGETMKLVGELCEAITGIRYPFDAEIINLTKQRERRDATLKAVETSLTQRPKPRKRGRPKGTADVGKTRRRKSGQE